jgi:hypothetical protein
VLPLKIIIADMAIDAKISINTSQRRNPACPAFPEIEKSPAETEK